MRCASNAFGLINSFLALAVGCFLGVLLAQSGLRAQTPSGELQVSVKDPTGAPVSASGRLENLSTGLDRRFETDALGNFTLDHLAFGHYRLTVSRPGFATSLADVNVQTSAPIARTFALTLGAVTETVNVVASAPLPGADRPLNEIAGPVQTANDGDMDASGALNLADFMNRRLSGVYLNEIQGNPVQPDLNYRGYTASPLLGTPQGISIYMDGVRLNQAFGDQVSWDLIPQIAIAETVLIPGSNPLFGLNTLGGALTLQTKDGRNHPGTELELAGGSFGRKMATLQHGGSNKKGLNWFGAANLLFDDGWKPVNPSDVRQFFGKVGWQGKKTVLSFTGAYANNLISGSGLQEQRALQRDYSSVYTKPDITGNRSPFGNLTVRHSLTNALTFAGNTYYRYIRTNTFNGDLNTGSLDQSVYQPSTADIAALRKAGFTGFPTSGANAANTPFPFWRCIAQALQRDEPAEKCNGLINRSHALQRNYGASGQLTRAATLHGFRNQFTGGAAFDGNRVGYEQSTELGFVNPDRSITGVGAYGDGVTGGNVNGELFDTRVHLKGSIRNTSVYATDTFSKGKLSVTLSGRFNHAVLDNSDLIRPSGAGTLSSTNIFNRFNPAASVTYALSPAWNAYFGYSEGNRAPTSIELGCANPNLPCKLPNALASDPPLKQVVTRTIETGVRGGSETRLHWSAGYFRSDNRDDLLFVAAPESGFGYFKNFGRTRRQGVEADLHDRFRRVTYGAGYTFLDATFQTPEIVNGTGNSSNQDAQSGVKGIESTLAISPGNRIPLIPQHTLKVYADIQVTAKLFLDANLIGISSSFARGNENNQHQSDGVYYLGPGTSPAYTIMNLSARYQLFRRAELFVRVNNIFNRQYYSAAQLASTGFNAAGNFIARPFAPVNGVYPLQHTTFLAPGAPIGVWGGVKIRF